MIEDKLTHDERLRLECLAQANALLAGARAVPSATSIWAGRAVEVASALESYVRGPDAP